MQETTATLTVGAFGGTPLSYQWQKNGSPLSNGGNISGATTATLTISNLLPADGALLLGGGQQQLQRRHQRGGRA